MSKVIIGIDPDSKAHGLAVYIDGKLDSLLSLSLIGFMSMMEVMDYPADDIECWIEDVSGSSAIFAGRFAGGDSQAVRSKKAQHVGMCKQAQIELERVIEHLGFKLVRVKVSKQWKKDKSAFELATGWKGKSNEDTRSAAYFGWLGCKTNRLC